jgi:hypothetical protein
VWLVHNSLLGHQKGPLTCGNQRQPTQSTEINSGVSEKIGENGLLAGRLLSLARSEVLPRR